MKDEYDEIDKIILYELNKNCRISDTKLAKIVKKSKEAVRYRIKKMLSSRAISSYSVHINPAKLGNLGYKIYIRLREKEELKNKFIEHLKKRKDVIWVCTGDGNWNMGITFYAKNHEEFYKHKNELFSKFQNIVASQTIGLLVNVQEFTHKYLVPQDGYIKKLQEITTFEGYSNHEIDDLDKKIVSNLLENGRIRLVELASKCSSNIDTVRNRIKKLEKDGIIVAYVANIRTFALGFEFYKSFLYFEGLDKEKETKFYNYCKTHPNIVAYVRVIAPWDVELEIVAKNYREYLSIINGLKKEFVGSIASAEFMVLERNTLYPAREKIFENE